MKKRSGFTLAEILVTLGVIGVIASMTVPTLVQDIQEASWKAGYKKAFASASQAWKMALNDNLIINRSSTSDGEAGYSHFQAFKTKFTVVKDCSNNSDCWAGGEYFKSSTPQSNAPAFVDGAGMSWSIRYSNIPDQYNYYIFVDINGFKGPSKWGRDRFVFYTSCEGDNSQPCVPIRIRPVSDYLDVDTVCPSGKCYYTSWLKQ